MRWCVVREAAKHEMGVTQCVAGLRGVLIDIVSNRTEISIIGNRISNTFRYGFRYRYRYDNIEKFDTIYNTI